MHDCAELRKIMHEEHVEIVIFLVNYVALVSMTVNDYA